MNKALWAGTVIGVVSSLIICSPAMAQGEAARPAVVKTAELLSYARIYTGQDDETHFDDVSVTFTYEDYGEKIPTVWLSQDGLMSVKGLHFVSMPAGWVGGELHPSPARQFIIPLSGEMVFQTSDGETRTFGPGDVLLVEDTEGKGHTSKMVSSSLGVFAVVPMPD